MSALTNKLSAYLKLFGINFSTMGVALRGLSLYQHDLKELKRQQAADNQFPLGKKRPIFEDRFSEAGTMSGHYFHQDLYVARKIFENKPQRHVDIGSRTDGFVAHLAVFREVEVFDIREQNSLVKNIVFKTADLMQLPSHMIGYCDSISALHSIEHFGLGRYGDPIDYNGHLKAIENIMKILASGGKFYFSVPVGPQRINFNAHRVFSIQYLLNIFNKDFTVDAFSYVNDQGSLIENADLTPANIAQNFGCNYGCGIFELTKK
jgi:SAM-dependent methyltransferase